MKIYCSIILTIAAISGFAAKSLYSAMINKNPIAGESLTYLALGDSYTIGEAVPQNQSFPYQLAAQLHLQGINLNDPTIIATTGWITDELIDAILHSGITGEKFDLVTLLVGVNDQYRGMSKDNYRAQFEQVLNTALQFAGGDKNRVFVLSIPDWGVTPFANGQGSVIGPQIDQFNAINKQISMAASVHYLDITGISRQSEPDLVAADGLHPSGKMYALWVQQLLPMVVNSLK